MHTSINAQAHAPKMSIYERRKKYSRNWMKTKDETKDEMECNSINIGYYIL